MPVQPLPALLLLVAWSGCFAPDYTQKPCVDRAGCPAGYVCARGHCSVAPDVPEGRIPGGTFHQGGDDQGVTFGASLPVREVSVPTFFLDEREVTVGRYDLCLQAGACTEPATGPGCNFRQSGRADHPINCVDFAQAQAFCAWLGRRLPTESEWEYAARGGAQERVYPWSAAGTPDAPDAQLCWRRPLESGTCAGCTYPRSAYALCDMAGGVWEWTGSALCAYDNSGCVTPTRYVVRGGSWTDTDPKLLRAAIRLANLPTEHERNRGFRCARDLAPTDP